MRINLQDIIASMERSVQMYNSLLPKSELERISQMAETVAKSFDPVIQMIQNPAFQRQMQEINRIAENIRKSVEQSHALTLPALRMMEELYGTVDKASEDIASTYSIPEAMREEVITRPIFSETKLKIRKGIPSVKKILPLSLPKNTCWEDIQMRFVDPHTVFIKITKHEAKITADYRDMGMQDLRSDSPNAQWIFLRGLADYNNEVTWNTPIASVSLKKQKQLLSDCLKKYFGIDSDPFQMYRKEKSYRLKLFLVSNKQAKDETSDTEKYFEENAPEVYDSKEFFNDN